MNSVYCFIYNNMTEVGESPLSRSLRVPEGFKIIKITLLNIIKIKMAPVN